MAAAMLDAELIFAMRREPTEPPTPLQKAVKAEAFKRGLHLRNTGLPGYGPGTTVGVSLGG